METIINRNYIEKHQALTFYNSEQEVNADSISKGTQLLKIYIKKIELHIPLGVEFRE